MGNLIMLDECELGVLGELGASLFPGPEGVRAKDAKDAKVRKAITGMIIDHPVLFDGKCRLHRDMGILIMLDDFDLGVLGELGASLFPGPEGGSRKGRKG